MSVAVPVIDYVDPATRRVHLLSGVEEYHPLDDIYAEIRNLRVADESMRKYFVFIQGGGNIPKNVTGTLRTPRYAIFKNCKVVVSGDTNVLGEQLYADENGDVIGKGKDCIDHALSPADAYVDYEPPGSEVIVPETASITEQDKMDIADRVHDEVVEDGLTLKQMLRIFLSALAGPSSGGGTTQISFRDKLDAKSRITGTVDDDGNRTDVQLDGE